MTPDAKRRRIGLVLRNIREKRNIGQESAAKAIGMSRTHLSNIEVGRSAPSSKRLQAMCAFYEVSLGEVLKSVDDAVEAPRLAEPPWPGHRRFSQLEEWMIDGLLLLPKALRLKVVTAWQRELEVALKSLGDQPAGTLVLLRRAEGE